MNKRDWVLFVLILTNTLMGIVTYTILRKGEFLQARVDDGFRIQMQINRDVGDTLLMHAKYHTRGKE